MKHAFANFLEPLESRRHLSAHPLATTPSAPPVSAQQVTQIDLGMIAAYVAAFSGATASAAPLATPPANSTGTDILTELSSPDWLDQLLGGSGGPAMSGPSNPGNGLTASGSAHVGVDGVTIAPSLFNLG